MMTASRPTFHFYKLAVLFSTHASELNRLYNVGSADGTAYSILLLIYQTRELCEVTSDPKHQ
jgi:hypothetical protein